jgi:threonine aldolase
MDAIDRRNFLMMGSAGAASLGLGGAGRSGPGSGQESESGSGRDGGGTGGGDASREVRLHGDGLDLSPAEFADRLARVAADEGISPDYYSVGGVVESLERRMAELLGKERAVFLPTGTLANQLAVRRLAGEGGRVLLQEESHLYNDSGDCLSVLSHLQVIALAPGRATFTVDEVREEIERAAGGKVATPVRAISIESPVRRLWGQVFDFAQMQAISAAAREQGIGLHLDGARVFLAEPYTGVAPAEYAALFDTVYVSLWKYFNCGSGAILAGPAALLDDLFHTRRMFGGSLPAAWMLAAVASHYLPGFRERFAEAAGRSEEVFRQLESHAGFAVERIAGGTNIAKLRVSQVDPALLRERLKQVSIDLPEPIPVPVAGESVFKIQVNESWLRQPPEAIVRAIVEAAR